jgi:hypothetical protein
MKKYIGIKEINAKPMTHGDYYRFRGWDLKDKDENTEGYLVEYEPDGHPNHPDFKGYISWSPKTPFEKAYREIEGMTFGAAIELLKRGKKVARKGWNGKNMFLWLKPATTISSDKIYDPILKEIAEQNGGTIPALGTICMKTATGEILTGWLASQTDMLLEDWVEV